MKDKLYIDGIEVDLPEGGSGIVLNRAVSKPADMSTILSGYSYTIQLPKTAHNVQAFGYSTEVNVDSDFPHIEHTAKVIRDGITLFDDGVAVVKSASKTIEVLVKFGGNKRLNLLNDYKLKDVFPDSGLIPWDYSVTENDFVTWVPKLDGMQRQHPEHLRPAVKVSILFDMIVGQSFIMNNAYRSMIEKMWLMLPTTNGSKEVADNLAFRLRGSTTSDQIASRQCYDILPDLNYQNALYHQKLYDLIYRTLPVTCIKIPLGGRYRINGTINATNVLTGWKFGIFSSSSEFKDGEIPMFDIFEKAVKEIDEYADFPAGDICFGIYDPFNTGKYEIDLTISFAPESEKDYSQTAFLLDYPIRENLPDMSTMDFIKSVMGVFGLMVEQNGDNLAFFNVNDVILNKSDAVNISRMLIDKKDDKLEYSYGLTKKNVLKYAEDDLVDKSFGSYTFIADTYDKQENTVYQSPYAATDKNIPLYTYKVEDGKAEYTLNKTSKCRLLLENGTVSLDVWGKWIDADMKTVTFRSFTFEPLMYENLVRQYWVGYLGVYANKPRISHRKAKLNPTFLPDLSFRKPLYIDGNYYMLLSVNNYTETGKADLELALIDGVDITESGGGASVKNAILVNPTTPLKFSATDTALYTAASVTLENESIETDGKMIRELDTLGSLSATAWIAVDTGFGDAKKINLHTMQSENDNRYLRKDIDDTAHGIISFDQKIGSSIFLDGYDGKGWEIKETGAALFDSAQVRSDIFMGGKIGSPSFASGFTGWGWEIDTPTASGTVDNWTVRKSMKVYEMVYSQVYGLNSSFLISDWNKIKSVTPLGSKRYRCELDDLDSEMFLNLRNGDIVRTQKRDGWNIRYFASEVENISSKTFDLKVINGMDFPLPGDYVQRIGNKTDKNRQGLIYFTSSDDYAPYIDVLDGVTSAQFGENNTKVRIGNLRGIRINGEPINMHGIYINGGIFERSTYYLEDGNTIEQHFSIMDGKLTSEIEGVRNDISGEKGNILRNSSFASNLNYWTAASNVHFIPVMGGFMWLPSAFYVDKETVSDIYRDGSRNVLRIRNNNLTQINGVLNLPAHSEASEDGLYTYSFSFHYKVLRAGTLTAGIKGTELYTTQSLTESEEYQLLFHEGMWNEQGDFEISFTGEILIYGATLRNDTSADAFIYMKTGIEQSEEKIRLWATKEIKDTEGRITTKYDSQFKITAEEINQRVTRQEFNNETGKIREEYDGELSVMSNRINQRVTYSEFDSATSNLRRSLESSISVQAGRITTVSKEVDAVKNTITSAGWITQTTGNTLWAKKDLENGKTLISAINQTAEAIAINASKINLNGVVTANSTFQILIDGSLRCTGGTIGGFTIKQYSLESGGLTLTGGQIQFKKNRGVEVIIGGLSVSTGTQAAAIFTNDNNSGGTDGNGTVLSLRAGRSAYTNAPQCWIDCDHSGGWGSKFRVESRYFNDANQMERTAINVGHLMSHVQVKALSSNAALYPVYYDNNSGFLCYMY